VKIAAELAAKELEESIKSEEDDIVLVGEAINGLYFIDPRPFTSKT
jgi:hypothetical protein